MPEQIYTFTAEEVAKMLESGELRLLTAPEPVQKPPEKTEHEKALEKAKKLFGEDFEDVQTLEIGGKTVEQLKSELMQANTVMSYYAEEMFNTSFATLPSPEKIEIVKLKVKDLGFEDSPTVAQIYQKAEELGLELCPAEVGPHLRLKDINQPDDDLYYIAVDGVVDLTGHYHLFCLGHTEGGFWLHDARPDFTFEHDSNCIFVFRIS